MAAPAFQGGSHCTRGVLPNSPLHQMMVLSSRPFSESSCSSAAMALSICGSRWRMAWKCCRCVSHPGSLIVMYGTPRSTSLRAARHDCPNVFRSVSLADVVFFLRQVEDFPRVAEDELVRRILGLHECVEDALPGVAEPSVFS